jgi:hypothetical protein
MGSSDDRKAAAQVGLGARAGGLRTTSRAVYGPGAAPLVRLLLCALLLWTLAGCVLVSGEETTIDLQGGSGNLSTSFVGAEGREERSVAVGDGPSEVQVIAILALESGDLQIELLQPDGGLAFAVEGRPDAEVTRSGLVRADAQGQIRYRVTARGARNGAFQLFFQP